MQTKALRPSNLGKATLLFIGGFAMLFPFFWMASSSFKSDVEAFATPPTIWPEAPTLGNYEQLFELLDAGQLLMNSILVSFVVTSVQLLNSAMAGYAFARIHFKGKSILFAIYLGTMMIPMQVIVVPLFIEMRMLELVDTLLGLILPMIVSAFGVFFMRQAMLNIPRDLEEAAILDGAGHLRIFFRIALPLTLPATSALTVLTFMASWNAYLWPLIIIYSPELMTIPLGLANLHGQYTTDWPVVMAGTTLAVLPIAILYIFLQKHITQSFLTAGLRG